MNYILGIDFGTSNTMLKLSLQNGKSNDLATTSVTFTQQGYGSTPSLICKKGEAIWYGHEAEVNLRGDTEIFRNFKLGLNDADPDRRQEAAKLMDEFFCFLFRTFTEQKPFLVGDSENSTTVVSYPAQWQKEQRDLVLNAARKAGFTHVTGIDEPSASVICALKAKQHELERSGLLQPNKPLTILILDMGAGTTDLAFVRVTAEGGILQTDILDTWPKAGSAYLYGGNQMDLRLEAILGEWLRNCGLNDVLMKDLLAAQRSGIKQWKESTVSRLLAKQMEVTDFPAVSNILNMMGIQAAPFPVINRESFASDFRPELERFTELIASAPQELREQTELVILAGGNSEWFWVPQVLQGEDLRFGNAGLPQIHNAPERVIRLEQPADTVSRGLVYDRSNFHIHSWLRYDPKSRIRSVIAAGERHTVGVKSDGTVLAVGDNRQGQCNVSDWRDIVSVAAGRGHTVGLRADGKVVAVGDNSFKQCNVEDWSDIVSVSAGCHHTVGIRSNGTVVAVGCKDHGRCDVSDWQEIVSAAAGGAHTLGLRADGTVVAVGLNASYQCDVGGLHNIVSVAAGGNHSVFLRANGKVVAIGDNFLKQCDVDGFGDDNIAIAASGDQTMALSTDETVGAPDMFQWRNIIAIAAGAWHFVGLKEDGTVVAYGFNGKGQLSVGDTLKYGTKEPTLLGLTSKTVWHTCSQTPWKLF